MRKSVALPKHKKILSSKKYAEYILKPQNDQMMNNFKHHQNIKKRNKFVVPLNKPILTSDEIGYKTKYFSLNTSPNPNQTLQSTTSPQPKVPPISNSSL